jgi:hypothetical protein
MVKLINAGLGRTGTTSLQVALERFGYGPCYHMFDIVSSEARLAQWEKVVCDAQPPDWQAIFDGYTSAVDGPCAIYYAQIMRAFPDAKVILTVRDAEHWYRSTFNTLYQFALKGADGVLEANSRQSRLHRLTSTMVWNGLFGGRFSDKDHAIEVFHNHNRQVVRTVDPDNLLVYDVTQGWEPLCRFLGVDVPPEDFPHVNDTASMRKVIRQVSSGQVELTGRSAS